MRLLGSACFLEPEVLADQGMEEADAQLFLHVDLVSFGLNADSWYALVLGNHVHPVTIAFFGHGTVLTEY